MCLHMWTENFYLYRLPYQQLHVPVSVSHGTSLTNPPFHLCRTTRWKNKTAYDKDVCISVIGI